jgi:toxin CptA
MAVHGSALLLIPVLPLGVVPRALLALVVILGFAAGIGGQVVHLLPWSPREAVWHPDGSWTLTLASGRALDARLLPSSYVSPSLVVLSFRCGRLRYCSLVLLPDNLQPDLLRRLRVRLRLAGSDIPGASETAP